MKYPKIPLAQTLVQLCKAKDVKHIVISPGSRNAPLNIGFTHDDFFNCYSIVDERCAAFFALGIAQQIGKPVALVCTSGSALLNYYPAIAEAFYSHIPLIVLSADRPKYLVNIGDGQTINQPGVYKNHIFYSANLKQDLTKENTFSDENDLPIMKSIENKIEKYLGLQKSIQQYNEEEINKAINTCIVKDGPVHINIPFNEPLYDKVGQLTVNPKSLTPDINHVDVNHIDTFINQWNTAQKKMILVGVNQPNRIEQEYLDSFANDDSVIVLTETTSNLHHKRFFPSIDKLIAPLSEDDLKALQPEILLTFGGMIVSKKVKAFLRDHKPKTHWHIGKHKANDTFFCLKEHFKVDVNTFFQTFCKSVKKTQSHYQNEWQEIMKTRREKHEQYIKDIPFSDFKAFHCILNSLPESIKLQVGNSSAIRYLQLFDVNKNIEMYCNRGTSGIDGSTSTAIGAATVTDNQTVFITGDLSFFYDSNAFWNNYIPNNFRVIIINNKGGGIFRILPGDKNTENFDTYFETTHHLNAKQLCEMYKLEYKTASNTTDLKSALELFYQESSRPKVLEIFTPREDNDAILLKYFKAVK